MRVRSRGSMTNLVNVWSSIRISDGVVLSSGQETVAPPNGRTATIWDDTTKRTGKLKQTRYCKHIREDSRAFPMSGTYWDGATPRKYTDSSYIGGYTTLTFRSSFDGLPHLKALEYFKAGCQEQELLMANIFMEFKSIKSTFDFLKGSWKKLKTYADGYLSYEFGIKPLLKDAETLAKFMAVIPERLAWLRKNQGKPVKVSFTRDVSELYPELTHTYTGSSTIYHSRMVTSAKYRAYALLVYDVAQLSDLELKARLATRALGFDNPIGIVWEAIPYSFVVDWLLKVGDFLDALAPKITLPYKFLDVGWTLRVTESLDYWATTRYPRTAVPGKWNVGNRRRTSFIRSPGLPVNISSLQSGDPGLKQLALATALVVQKYG